MAFKSGIQQSEKRIQELKQFVDTELSQALGTDEPTVSSTTALRQSLETLSPTLKNNKLNIKVIADEQRLIDQLRSIYEKTPAVKALFNCEVAALDMPDSIAFGDVVIGLAQPEVMPSEAFNAFAKSLNSHTVLKFILVNVVPAEMATSASSVPAQKTAQCVDQCMDQWSNKWLHKHVPQLSSTAMSLCFESFLYPPEPAAEPEAASADLPAEENAKKPRGEGQSRSKAASSRIRERKRRMEKKAEERGGRRSERRQRTAAIARSPVTEFCDALVRLAEENKDAIACQPVITELTRISDQLMDMLTTREQQLNCQLSSEKAKIATAKEINVQQQVGIVFRKADQKIDEVLGKSRADVSTLKGILLDAQDVRSIKSQLQQQIDTLYPVVSDLQGTMELELFHQDKADIHQSLVQLTGDFLNSWSQKAWRRIFSAPHRDGLCQLCEALPQIITLAPVLAPAQPEVFQARLDPTFNIQHLFNSEYKASFVWCRRYKFPTFIKFVFKDLRTNLMAVTGLVMLLSYVLTMAPEKEAASTTFIQSATATIDLFGWFQNVNPNLKGISI